jgi:tRNA pseudouridine32 synthase/23S rRNA pseudouridine746 synthase
MNPEDNLEESIIWPMPTGAEQASGQFPDPFRLAPHPTATACAKALQEYLQCHLSIMHELTQTGKMFGVLAVENERGEKGFLAAFSGKLCGKNILPRFVPPVFDLSDETLFFRKGEKEISGLNETIEEIEHSVSMTQASEKWKKQKAQWEHTLREARHSAMENKKSRDEKRRRIALSEDEIWKKEALDRLNKESAREKSELKKLRQSAEVETHSARNTLDLLLAKAEELKTLRKEKSAELQKALFEAYIFPNGKGEEKNLQEIFSAAGLLTPPAGAGDCAAPKLVHFALRQKLKPLALAEFWWGAPPVDEIRKPGFFYPPCRGKCEPILGHILQ